MDSSTPSSAPTSASTDDALAQQAMSTLVHMFRTVTQTESEARIRSLETRTSTLLDDHARIQATLSVTQQDLAAVKSSNRELQTALANHASYITNQQATITSLNHEIAALLQRYSSLAHEVGQFQSRIAAAHHQLNESTAHKFKEQASQMESLHERILGSLTLAIQRLAQSEAASLAAKQSQLKCQASAQSLNPSVSTKDQQESPARTIDGLDHLSRSANRSASHDSDTPLASSASQDTHSTVNRLAQAVSSGATTPNSSFGTPAATNKPSVASTAQSPSFVSSIAISEVAGEWSQPSLPSSSIVDSGPLTAYSSPRPASNPSGHLFNSLSSTSSERGRTSQGSPNQGNSQNGVTNSTLTAIPTQTGQTPSDEQQAPADGTSPPLKRKRTPSIEHIRTSFARIRSKSRPMLAASSGQQGASLPIHQPRGSMPTNEHIKRSMSDSPSPLTAQDTNTRASGGVKDPTVLAHAISPTSSTQHGAQDIQQRTLIGHGANEITPSRTAHETSSTATLNSTSTDFAPVTLPRRPLPASNPTSASNVASQQPENGNRVDSIGSRMKYMETQAMCELAAAGSTSQRPHEDPQTETGGQETEDRSAPRRETPELRQLAHMLVPSNTNVPVPSEVANSVVQSESERGAGSTSLRIARRVKEKATDPRPGAQRNLSSRSGESGSSSEAPATTSSSTTPEVQRSSNVKSMEPDPGLGPSTRSTACQELDRVIVDPTDGWDTDTSEPGHREEGPTSQPPATDLCDDDEPGLIQEKHCDVVDKWSYRDPRHTRLSSEVSDRSEHITSAGAYRQSRLEWLDGLSDARPQRPEAEGPYYMWAWLGSCRTAKMLLVTRDPHVTESLVAENLADALIRDGYAKEARLQSSCRWLEVDLMWKWNAAQPSKHRQPNSNRFEARQCYFLIVPSTDMLDGIALGFDEQERLGLGLIPRCPGTKACLYLRRYPELGVQLSALPYYLLIKYSQWPLRRLYHIAEEAPKRQIPPAFENSSTHSIRKSPETSLIRRLSGLNGQSTAKGSVKVPTKSLTSDFAAKGRTEESIQQKEDSVSRRSSSSGQNADWSTDGGDERNSAGKHAPLDTGSPLSELSEESEEDEVDELMDDREELSNAPQTLDDLTPEQRNECLRRTQKLIEERGLARSKVKAGMTPRTKIAVLGRSQQAHGNEE